MSLEKKLEAVLFYKGEPETKTNLVKLLHTTPEELEEAVKALSVSMESRGIRLLRAGDELELVTAPETSEVINQFKKEEMVRDLGKAGSETLAIILYRGPVSRADIDYIRGVQSTFILRNLQIRGLVAKIQNQKNSRIFLYQATPELLKYLGVTVVEELPNYKEMREQLNAFESERKEDVQKEEGEEIMKEETI